MELREQVSTDHIVFQFGWIDVQLLDDICQIPEVSFHKNGLAKIALR